jgi:hypothetical protein
MSLIVQNYLNSLVLVTATVTEIPPFLSLKKEEI